MRQFYTTHSKTIRISLVALLYFSLIIIGIIIWFTFAHKIFYSYIFIIAFIHACILCCIWCKSCCKIDTGSTIVAPPANYGTIESKPNCYKCGNTGRYSVQESVKCSNCGGSGRVPYTSVSNGVTPSYYNCGGSGRRQEMVNHYCSH